MAERHGAEPWKKRTMYRKEETVMNKVKNDYDYWSKRAAIFDDACDYIGGECTQEQLGGWLNTQFRKTDRVLEMGCGTGNFSEMIAGRVKHLIATDMSPEMLERARARLATHDHVEVRPEDCYGTSFEENTFDAVLLANLLHVVTAPTEVLKEAGRVLKEGGRIIVLSHTFSGVPLIPKLGMLSRYLLRFGLPPLSGRMLDIQNLRGFVEEAGYVVEETQLLGNKAKTVCLTAGK